MIFTLEIQRRTGIDRRSVTPGVLCGEAEGKCPGCGAEPFLVAGTGVEQHAPGVLRAGGKSMCCSENVGFLYAEESTIFGREEDENMLGPNKISRCRVY